MSNLPVELVHWIFKEAAIQAICTHRQWVAQSLSVVSRAVHIWVAPVLWQALYVPRDWHRNFHDFVLVPDPARTGNLHSTTTLIVDYTDYMLDWHANSHFTATFAAHLTVVSVPAEMFGALALSSHFRPRTVFLESRIIATKTPQDVLAAALSRVTHLYSPSIPALLILAAGGLYATQVPLPELTHLLIDTRISCNTSLLPHVLCLPRLQRVLLYLTPALRRTLGAVKSLNDPRVCVTSEDSAFLTVTHAARAFRDRREIWEEGEPVDSEKHTCLL